MDKKYLFLAAGLAAGLALSGPFAYYYFGQPEGAGGTLLLTGDTPQDTIIPVRDIFVLGQEEVRVTKGGVSTAYRGVPVPAFLAAYGLGGADRIVFYADDFMAMVNVSDITDETILAPYEGSLRVVSSELPASVSVKGVWCVVAIDDDAAGRVALNGKNISYGGMLDEGVDTMTYDRLTAGYEIDGVERHVESAYVANGISLRDLLAREGVSTYSNVTVSNRTYSGDEVLRGDLFVTRYRGTIRLAIPDRALAEWPVITSIEAA